MYFKHIPIAAALALYCYISVPYPACYYVEDKKEFSDVIEISFKKNDFFGDCKEYKGKLVQTKKDVRVFLDGQEYQTIKAREICPEEF